MKTLDINLNARLLFIDEEIQQIKNDILEIHKELELTQKQREDYFYHYIISLLIEAKKETDKNLIFCIQDDNYNIYKKQFQKIEKLIKISFMSYFNKEIFLKQEQDLFYINVIKKLNDQSNITSSEKLLDFLKTRKLNKTSQKFRIIKAQMF